MTTPPSDHPAAHKNTYPPSPVIKSIDISSECVCIGHGDNWPVTWAANDAFYAIYCDGVGFADGKRFGDKEFVSQGLAEIQGFPPDIRGINIPSPTGETQGGGTRGRKACGLLSANGMLYMWVRNLNEDGTGSILAWSKDNGLNWAWAAWDFSEIGYPVWLNAGRDYRNAQDNYAYMYSPDSPSAYLTTDHMLLARVPKDRITEKEAYQFFSGLDESGNPRWMSDFADRQPAFTDPGHCFRPDVVYNPYLKRYLLCTATSGDLGFGATAEKYLGIYDAPNPWGPWTTAKQIPGWNPDENRFHPRIPAKWIAPDGKSFYLLYSCFPKGSYRFNIERCSVEVFGE